MATKHTKHGEHFGHLFKDPNLLERALIHKSYGNENRSELSISKRDNEQLEFLGDAVLDLIISKFLLEAYPESSEGELSKLRAGLVNEKTLAQIARSLKLGEHICLGKGEDQTGGRDKDSILSSSLEALIAAIYNDSDIQTCEQWLRANFWTWVIESKVTDPLRDYKTRLQEIVQARYKVAPRYEVISSMGPDHEKTFEIQVLIHERVLASASGKSKKEAEQNAAQKVLENLINNPGEKL